MKFSLYSLLMVAVVAPKVEYDLNLNLLALSQIFPPAKDFLDPEISDATLAKHVALTLQDVFGVKPSTDSDLQKVLIEYVSLTYEKFKETASADRLDPKLYEKELEDFFAEHKESIMYNFHKHQIDLYKILVKGIVASAMSSQASPNAVIEFFSKKVHELMEYIHSERQKREQEDLNTESDQYRKALKYQEHLNDFIYVKYKVPDAMMKAIETISQKMKKAEITENLSDAMVFRCVEFIKVLIKAASNKKEDLTPYLVKVSAILARNRWNAPDQDPSTPYMRWNARLIKEFLNLIADDGNLGMALYLAVEVLNGPQENTKRTISQKLGSLLKMIMQRTNPIPAFKDDSLATNMRRLFYMDILKYTLDTTPEGLLSVSNRVCTEEDVRRTLKNFDDLIRIPLFIFDSQNVAKLYIKFFEGDAYAEGLQDSEILSFLYIQLNAVYGFRMLDPEGAKLTSPAEVAGAFDRFLDSHHDLPELNLNKFYPLIKVVNGINYLARTDAKMNELPLTPEAKDFLTKRISTPEFSSIRKGLLGVFGHHNTVYQHNVDDLDFVNQFSDVSFPAEVLLKDVEIVADPVETHVNEIDENSHKPQLDIPLQDVHEPKKTRKNLVNRVAGDLPEDVSKMLEDEPNVIARLKAENLLPNVKRPYDIVLGWVQRPTSPCFQK